MINPKVKAATLDFMKSQIRPGHTLEGQELHNAYAAECRLFGEHFNGMEPNEVQEYKEFVNWLDFSEMWKSDLTVDELYDAFEQIRYDDFMEEYDSSLDEYSEEF